MKVFVNAGKIIRPWPHVEQYQNTTLRYSPGEDFPAFLTAEIGQPKIIRLFITLDEVWDYRTDEFHWDYLIGVNHYTNDPNHYPYDWPMTVPSVTGTHELAYLQSHAAHADEVLLNLRRYERELTDGIITAAQYERVIRLTVAHYKKIIPNIRYIEIGNEPELEPFGNLSMSEYYRLYQIAARAIQSLNQENHYELPLLIGGCAMGCGMWHIHLWRQFLELLASDKNRILDFYSFHEYHNDPGRIAEFCLLHQEWIQKLNLPDLPLFMTEYGLRNGLGDAGRPTPLQNASGEIPGMILGSHYPQLKMFPWCTFHNPHQQIGRTMFLRNAQGQYVATPNGHVMEMFHRLKTFELECTSYNGNRSVATIDSQGNISILACNPEKAKECIHLRLDGLTDSYYHIREFMVSHQLNNCLSQPAADTLKPTFQTDAKLSRHYEKDIWFEPESFCLFEFQLDSSKTVSIHSKR